MVIHEGWGEEYDTHTVRSKDKWVTLCCGYEEERARRPKRRELHWCEQWPEWQWKAPWPEEKWQHKRK